MLPTSDQVGFHLASTHQMAPQHRLTGLLLIYRPRKDERLSWPSWLTCSGRFTHIVVTRRLQAERRTGSVHRPKTGVLPTVLRNCNMIPPNTTSYEYELANSYSFLITDCLFDDVNKTFIFSQEFSLSVFVLFANLPRVNRYVF